MKKIKIRPMNTSDISEAIYIDSKNQYLPWTESQFAEAIFTKNSRAIVSIPPSPIVGVDITNIGAFIVYDWQNLDFMLLHVGTLPQYQRQGHATALITPLLRTVRDIQGASVWANVDETQLDMLLFLRVMGFRAKSIMKSPTPENEYDSIRMVFDPWETRRKEIAEKAGKAK